MNGDTVDAVTLTSGGAAADAQVGDGPFAIFAEGATGTGLDDGAGNANYDIAYGYGYLTVDPASLVITADDRAKTYGEGLVLGTTGFTVDGLVNGDTVDAVTLTSAGAAATANVGTGSYAIDASAASGTGLTGGETGVSNYTITYVPGTLVVTPASLVITADDRSKTYGEALTLGSTAFTAEGLVNSDTVDAVTLASAGAAATANVGTGSYAIDASKATGTGLDDGAGNSNYSITYVPGTLTVTPASLVITADDRSKTYGEALDLGSTAFTAEGLVNSDSVDAVVLTSAGAAATANVGTGSYAIDASAASGTGLDDGAGNSNYSISYVPGTLVVTPASLVITADDRTKTYGEAFDLGSAPPSPPRGW